MSGWYSWLKDTKYEDPRKVFTVHDDMIHISGDGLGCITTKEEYRDYRLVTEWKWGERTWGARKKATKDSGILVHCTGRDGGYSGIWMASIEAQIIQGGCGDFIVVAGNNEDGSPVPLSITAEVVKDRDGESVWHKKGASRKNLPAAGSTGSAVIRTGKTRSAFAVPKRSKSRMASGTGWR